MAYNITAIGHLRWPALDGRGGVYGLVDVVDERGVPSYWDGERTRPIEGAPRSSMLRVNAKGDLVLNRTDWQTQPDGVLLSSGRITELGLVRPLRINDSLQIVGRNANNRGVIWQDGEITLLPEGFDPVDINNPGVVAGDLELDPETSVPAIWASGQLTRINVEGVPLLGANAINDNGQVLVDGWQDDENEHRDITAIGLWKDGQYTPIELPYQGNTMGGHLNQLGDVVVNYWIDVGPPYVYEESVFLWKDGQSSDVNALVKGHLGITDCAGIDDQGRLLVSDQQNLYMLSPRTASSATGPMERPEAPARFLFFREGLLTRGLRHLGQPGALRVTHYLESLFGRGNIDQAIDPAKIRVGRSESDPMVIVDDNGITTPHYGYMPWNWIEGVLAFDIEGHLGLSIHLNRCPEWHNRFPDAKAFIIWLEKDVKGGRVEDDRYEPVPLQTLFPMVEAFVQKYVPRKEVPS